MKVKLYSVCKIAFCEMNGTQIWPMIGPIFQMGKKIGFTHCRAINMMEFLGDIRDQAIENLVCGHEIKNLQELAAVP